MDKSTGGPAFPRENSYFDGETYVDQVGMSLRDYFAASAAQGMLASGRVNIDKVSRSSIAEYAYEHADAMLAARAK